MPKARIRSFAWTNRNECCYQRNRCGVCNAMTTGLIQPAVKAAVLHDRKESTYCRRQFWMHCIAALGMRIRRPTCARGIVLARMSIIEPLLRPWLVNLGSRFILMGKTASPQRHSYRSIGKGTVSKKVEIPPTPK